MIPRDLQDAVDVAYVRMVREGVEEREASFNLKEAVTRQAEKACDLAAWMKVADEKQKALYAEAERMRAAVAASAERVRVALDRAERAKP